MKFNACNNFFVLALKMIAEDNASVNLAASKFSVPRKTLDFRLKLMKNRGRGDLYIFIHLTLHAEKNQ